MAYEPTNWKSGDVVTSAKLNKIEGGIASCGVLVIDYNGVSFPSYNDILAAIAGGKIVMVTDTSEPDAAACYYFIAAVFDDSDNTYKAHFIQPPDSAFILSAATKTDPMQIM